MMISMYDWLYSNFMSSLVSSKHVWWRWVIPSHLVASYLLCLGASERADTDVVQANTLDDDGCGWLIVASRRVRYPLIASKQEIVTLTQFVLNRICLMMWWWCTGSKRIHTVQYAHDGDVESSVNTHARLWLKISSASDWATEFLLYVYVLYLLTSTYVCTCYEIAVASRFGRSWRVCFIFGGNWRARNI